MTTATLNHPNVSQISLPVRGEGGDPLVSRDYGEPHSGVYEAGRLDPLPKIDQWNSLLNYTVTTTITASDAYARARRLADLFKSPPGTDPISFDPSLLGFDSNISTVPQGEQDSALTLTYPAGTKDYVEVEFGLTRVSSMLGSDSGQRANTPLASGSGPITLRNTSSTVDLGTEVTVKRDVGRPNDKIKRQLDTHPQYITKREAATDVFGIEFTFASNGGQLGRDLLDLLQARRGRTPLVLDFNGRYGLGAFDVQPAGSGAYRYVERAGDAGAGVVPRLDLQVVSDE